MAGGVDWTGLDSEGPFPARARLDVASAKAAPSPALTQPCTYQESQPGRERPGGAAPRPGESRGSRGV